MADTTDSKSVAERRGGSSPPSRTGNEMSIDKEYDIMQALWPIAIVQDRYMGTYTGGQWIAIARADVVPHFEETVWGDDSQCMEWAIWNVKDQKTAGVGNTPQEALDDLLSIPNYQDPRKRLRILEEAIRRHKETVTSWPERTAEAEDELWGLVE